MFCPITAPTNAG
ncbi:hypothetical protein TNIN_77101, partial [Trichonephila inaurata madagascariensis]